MRNLINMLDEQVVDVYNYQEFWLIVGAVFGIVLICAIVLFVHSRILKKNINSNK